jgi:hypothetical protein
MQSGFMRGSTDIPAIIILLLILSAIAMVFGLCQSSQFQEQYDPILVETTRVMIKLDRFKPNTISNNQMNLSDVKSIEWSVRKIQEKLLELPDYSPRIVEAHKKWAESVLIYTARIKSDSQRYQLIESDYCEMMTNYCRLKATVNDQENVQNSKKMGRRML